MNYNAQLPLYLISASICLVIQLLFYTSAAAELCEKWSGQIDTLHIWKRVFAALMQICVGIANSKHW